MAQTPLFCRFTRLFFHLLSVVNDMPDSTSSSIRVMIVDDHAMVRRGLVTFLKVFDDLQLAGEAESGEDAIRLCAEVLPDVILMDMVMPEMDGATATRMILQQFPQVKIIALTSYKEGDLIKDALEAGAIGYLFKNIPVDEIAHAIRTAHAGRATLSSEAAKILAQDAHPTQPTGLDLTEREREVLSLMIEGQHTLEIAERLNLSQSTIKSAIRKILAKFGVCSREEAVSLAVRQRIIS